MLSTKEKIEERIVFMGNKSVLTFMCVALLGFNLGAAITLEKRVESLEGKVKHVQNQVYELQETVESLDDV